MIGNYIIGILVLLYFLITLHLCRGLRLHTRDIAYGSLACALTLLLSYFPKIPIPTGSTIDLAILPLMLLALLYDYRVAIVSGFACGILVIFTVPGWAPVHWAQIPIEHLLCMTALGYAGVFGNRSRSKVLCGVVLATALKLTGHVLSGVLFFSQNAWEGWGPWGYSLSFNCSSIIPEGIIAAIVVMALPLPMMAKAIHGGNRP